MGLLRNIWEGFKAFAKSLGQGFIQILKGIFKVTGSIIGALAGILGSFYDMVAKGFYKLYMILLKPNKTTTIDGTIDTNEVEDFFGGIIDSCPNPAEIKFNPQNTAFAVITDENNKVVSAKPADIADVADSDVVKEKLNSEGIIKMVSDPMVD